MGVWEKVQKLWQRHDQRLFQDELRRESLQADMNANALPGSAPVPHTAGQLFDEGLGAAGGGGAGGGAPLSESDPRPPTD